MQNLQKLTKKPSHRCHKGRQIQRWVHCGSTRRKAAMKVDSSARSFNPQLFISHWAQSICVCALHSGSILNRAEFFTRFIWFRLDDRVDRGIWEEPFVSCFLLFFFYAKFIFVLKYNAHRSEKVITKAPNLTLSVYAWPFWLTQEVSLSSTGNYQGTQSR